MNKRLLCLGLLAVVSQLFITGCLCHPVARWRANHPCGVCGPCSHVGAHGPIMHKYAVRELPAAPAPAVGPSPCHGCNAAVGLPAGLNGGGSGELMPMTNPPTIGYPMPISPGPTVVPSYELHQPMPMSRPGN